jgi:hypothetical protein
VPGVVVGSIVAGIGLISASISRSGEIAKEADERIRGYVDALREVDDEAGEFAATQGIVRDFFAGLPADSKQFLIDSGVGLNTLTRALVDGEGGVDRIRAKLVETGNIRPLEGVAGAVTGAIIVALRAVAVACLTMDPECIGCLRRESGTKHNAS